MLYGIIVAGKDENSGNKNNNTIMTRNIRIHIARFVDNTIKY